MSQNRHAINVDDIDAARNRINGHVLRTPLIEVEAFTKRLGCTVHLKCENLQHGGAFKSRGATNAVLQIPDELAVAGVVTHSSGNHATALARAAMRRGIPAHVVMPHDAPPGKVAAVRSHGVDPIFCEPTTEDREATARHVQQQTGATLVHPYNQPEIMAGQGTVGVEILEQLKTPDAVLVPVGGGGLISGVAIAIKSLHPSTRVYGVEPTWADDTARSLAAGHPVPPNRYDSVADGLRTAVGDLTFPIIRDLVDDLFLVTEDEILQATRMIAETAHVVAEPSGAVALAGAQSVATRLAGQTIAVVVSGGNLNFKHCGLGKH